MCVQNLIENTEKMKNWKNRSNKNVENHGQWWNVPRFWNQAFCRPKHFECCVSIPKRYACDQKPLRNQSEAWIRLKSNSKLSIGILLAGKLDVAEKLNCGLESKKNNCGGIVLLGNGMYCNRILVHKMRKQAKLRTEHKHKKCT